MKHEDNSMLGSINNALDNIFTQQSIEKLQSELSEVTMGTPISPVATLGSKDRTKLEHLFNKIRDSIDPDQFTMDFQQNKIEIFLNKGIYGVTGRTPQDAAIQEQETHGSDFDYDPYIKSLFSYMVDKGLEIEPLPKVTIVSDLQHATGIFCKTATYKPNSHEVVLYVAGRHPKDILRSLSHEMIHHMQNLQGLIGNGTIKTTNTNEDDYLQKIEDQAYLLGNRCFRNWEDREKNKK